MLRKETIFSDYEDEKEDEEYEDEEEEEPPRNVGSLKYVESNIEFEKLRRVARLFVGNKFSLTELSFETRITNHYSVTFKRILSTSLLRISIHS